MAALIHLRLRLRRRSAGLWLAACAWVLPAAVGAAAPADPAPPPPGLEQRLEDLRQMAQDKGRAAVELAMRERLEVQGLAARATAADDGEGGGRAVDEHRPLNADGRVFVSNGSGSVVVSAWDKNEVAVSGDLGGGVERMDISGDAASLRVVVRAARHAHLSGSVDLRLMVPAAAQVSVETVSADVAVHGTRGPVKVNSVSGDVGLAVDAPEVAAQTVSGDLILQGPSANTAANSVSGDLRMSGLQGRLVAETVSGHIELAGGRFDELRLKSISGDMHLDLSFGEHATVVGETLSGDISLQVPHDVSGTAILKSFSGEAQCSLAQATSSASARKHEREYSFGDGKGVNLSLSTFSGDIHVEGK
ncbi:MAG: DUF4097 family beta strand repeat protein [Nevskia sp.]|nr:DUF4097 family beta strand repeat protein [Nevskia sp.]